MSADPWLLEPACPPSARPEKLFDPLSGVHGLRAAQTKLGPPRTLDVWLYQAPPAALADPSLWSLDPPPGGTPVPITAAVVEPNPTPHVELTLAGLPEPAALPTARRAARRGAVRPAAHLAARAAAPRMRRPRQLLRHGGAAPGTGSLAGPGLPRA